MFIKSFDTFFEKFEELLATDPFTARLVIKYCQRRKFVAISLRSDKRVVSHLIKDKTETKKLETILHRASEVLSNRKGVDSAMMGSPEAKTDGKKKKKGMRGNN